MAGWLAGFFSSSIVIVVSPSPRPILFPSVAIPICLLVVTSKREREIPDIIRLYLCLCS